MVPAVVQVIASRPRGRAGSRDRRLHCRGARPALVVSWFGGELNVRLFRRLAALVAALLLFPASTLAQPAGERVAQITSSPPAQPKRLVPTQTTASQQAALTD